MRILTSWDDGTETDKQLIGLLRAYDLPAIFFLPIMSWGFKNIDLYNGFEIGGHTYTHPADLKPLDDQRLETEIDLAKELLEKKTGKETEWFCYPRGRYDDRIMTRVAKAGFKFARTTKIGFMRHEEIVVKPYEMSGYHCYQRIEYKGLNWPEYIRRMILIAEKNKAEIFHIWGHSWEIDKFNYWAKLESLFKSLKGDKSGTNK